MKNKFLYLLLIVFIICFCVLKQHFNDTKVIGKDSTGKPITAKEEPFINFYQK